jgi:hypothetical protein
MGKQNQPIGPATVKWNDYVGTAAADDSEAAPGTRSLYQIAGLDRDRWTIVGFDIERWDRSHRVTVYVFDRRQQPQSSTAELLDLAEETGELPVTAVELTEPDQVKAFRREALKRTSIRLTARAISGQRLVVKEQVSADSRSGRS